MTTLEPVSVALKFGFIAVLYLFLLWVARSARKDLRGGGTPFATPRGPEGSQIPPDATGLYSASALGSARAAQLAPRRVVERAPGHDSGMIYDLDGDLVLGRGDRAEIRLEDPFASSRHARIFEQGNIVVIEDLGSTNGVLVNSRNTHGPQPLRSGDRVELGSTEIIFELG